MNRLELKLHNKILSVLTRDDVDQSVAAEIFRWREYRSAEDVIIKAIDPIVDVGAHIGLFTLYCRLLNEKVPIYALEPVKENEYLLKKNILENNFSNIETVLAALSVTSGEGNMIISTDNHRHCLSHSEKIQKNSQKVKTISLSDLLIKFKIKKISLLKMDIEGEENELLPNWSDEDFKCVGAIIMEYHNIKKDDCKKIENILRQRGYGVQNFPSRFDKKLGFMYAAKRGKNKII
ncbi:MAG: hypothetical protein COU29_04325 [Candidatus Magasanikbacteria bacterium CG10_big_fil_rev_8_21_14_0_10_36_32]|uniref:Methyltransferase FkbM domain-containing protein n=1 Tax=Candidatus Magasanikbacteria bacterium CG10_big_fil_rev_8_21_14_0_10_36_32 TaxID=1974646 RepID=A0A2M6W5E1_9BACT|nr:MAG: hypothetical protein COU29_04325 [Candidatus Magasanikbacteria bacterium CG10_big_fil_rev_8_21_14_0_10_36_32]